MQTIQLDLLSLVTGGAFDDGTAYKVLREQYGWQMLGAPGPVTRNPSPQGLQFKMQDRSGRSFGCTATRSIAPFGALWEPGNKVQDSGIQYSCSTGRAQQ